MAEVRDILVLGVLAIVFVIVLLIFAMRAMLISDFETGEMSVTDFVQKFNAKAIHFVIVDAALCIMMLLPPVSSVLLFLEVALVFCLDMYLIKTKRLLLDIIWAVRDMPKLKIRCIFKMIMLFMGAMTCIVKILI